MYKRILVTLDGSTRSEAVLNEVARLAGPGSSITLLTVGEPPEATVEPAGLPVVAGAPAAGAVLKTAARRIAEGRGQAIERRENELESYLEQKARPLREKGLVVETRVAFGNPVAEILDRARAEDAGLIAMATHGRTGLAQVVFGSVAARVLGSGVRPVFLVRPDRLTRAERE